MFNELDWKADTAVEQRWIAMETLPAKSHDVIQNLVRVGKSIAGRKIFDQSETLLYHPPDPFRQRRGCVDLTFIQLGPHGCELFGKDIR
jgi:hypothetical protein